MIARPNCLLCNITFMCFLCLYIQYVFSQNTEPPMRSEVILIIMSLCHICVGTLGPFCFYFLIILYFNSTCCLYIHTVCKSDMFLEIMFCTHSLMSHLLHSDLNMLLSPCHALHSRYQERWSLRHDRSFAHGVELATFSRCMKAKVYPKCRWDFCYVLLNKSC